MTQSKKQQIISEYAKRLNEALDDLGAPPKFKGRQNFVANLMNVSQKGAGRWLEGQGMPRTSSHQEHAKKLNVRAEWLFYGLGPKRKNETKDYTTELMNKVVELVDVAIDDVAIRGVPHGIVKSKLITSLFEMLKR